MEKKLKSGLTLTVVDLPVPILRYPKWLAVKFPEKLKEIGLVKLLAQSIPKIEHFAKEQKISQIKVATSPGWQKLSKVGLTKTVYYVSNQTSTLSNLSPKNYQVINLQDPRKVKDLIEGQFVYHCQYKPIYFTGNFSQAIPWFLEIVKRATGKKEGFFLGVKDKNKFIGFLYGEFYENEGCVDELFVAEKFRGQGFGKALIQKAGEEFQKRNIEKVGLFVGVDEESLGFYEKIGFKKEFVNWIKNLD